MSIGALPAILPVNFTVLGDGVVIRSTRGTKLDAAVAQRVVAFEADDHAPDGSWGWSVLIVGPGSEVVDPAQLAAVQATGLRSWAFDAEADRYLRIEIAIVSGRRFGAA